MAVGLWMSDVRFQPLPMPLGGAALFGWIGFWLRIGRARLRGLILGALGGATLGVIAHVRSHFVEDRVDSVGSLAVHVLGDLGQSLVGALLVLVLSVGWVGLLERRKGVGANPA